MLSERRRLSHYLTARSTQSFERLAPAARVSLMKRFVLLNCLAKPPLPRIRPGGRVRCETPDVTTEMSIGGTDTVTIWRSCPWSCAMLPIRLERTCARSPWAWYAKRGPVALAFHRCFAAGSALVGSRVGCRRKLKRTRLPRCEISEDLPMLWRFTVERIFGCPNRWLSSVHRRSQLLLARTRSQKLWPRLAKRRTDRRGAGERKQRPDTNFASSSSVLRRWALRQISTFCDSILVRPHWQAIFLSGCGGWMARSGSPEARWAGASDRVLVQNKETRIWFGIGGFGCELAPFAFNSPCAPSQRHLILVAIPWQAHI